MTMRIIIAGGRDFLDFNLLTLKCNAILRNVKSIEIVSGTCRGADKLGERYAKSKGFKIKEFPADWDRYGKRAGYLRNEEMADYADCLIAFWDGKSKGTKNMIDIATDQGLQIRVIRY